MWPWEHAAFAYLLFSVMVHARYRRGPSGPSALLVVGASQLPDIVDKPLGWELELFPTGFGATHSLFVAVPVGLSLALLAAQRDRSILGYAFVVGYWSHLLGDVIDPLRGGGSVMIERVLWPVVQQDPYAQDLGLSRGVSYLLEFAAEFPATGGTGLGVVYLLLPLGAAAVWLYDGAPGPGAIRRFAGRFAA